MIMKLDGVTTSSVLFQLLLDIPAEKAEEKLNVVHFLALAYKLFWEKWRMTLGSYVPQLLEQLLIQTECCKLH